MVDEQTVSQISSTAHTLQDQPLAETQAGLASGFPNGHTSRPESRAPSPLTHEKEPVPGNSALHHFPPNAQEESEVMASSTDRNGKARQTEFDEKVGIAS